MSRPAMHSPLPPPSSLPQCSDLPRPLLPPLSTTSPSTWLLQCQPCKLRLGQHVPRALVLLAAHAVPPLVQGAKHSALLRGEARGAPEGGTRKGREGGRGGGGLRAFALPLKSPPPSPPSLKLNFITPPPTHSLECALDSRVCGERLLAVQIQTQAAGPLQHTSQWGVGGSGGGVFHNQGRGHLTGGGEKGRG